MVAMKTAGSGMAMLQSVQYIRQLDRQIDTRVTMSQIGRERGDLARRYKSPLASAR